MKKIYLSLLFIGVFGLLHPSEVKGQSDIKDPIEGIDIYPNPVKGTKLYITSISGKSKTVTVFNVLGEKIMFKVMTTTELDISSLLSGVYILRVKIGEETFTKKVIIN
ncbi:T9SS type A sorting domain-containing protein [Aquimarina sp. RZ0]|uniref:T9SS type A sorting domain-containing protein n=1 Tax=Aquimarina sp. RZ0 TaxID=2607730 RepID=UPI00165FC902|nr:T9SS type A sorting domain-containing protein [Aquimarina sp. RZ0]